MTTLTEFVAAAVVHSSAAAFSHFGVAVEPTPADRAVPAVEHVVARTHPRPDKLATCPKRQPQQPIQPPELKA